jgi:hypothetical protein
MKELAKNLGPALVHDGREFRVTLNARIVNGHQDVRGVARAFVYAGDLDDDEAHPALGAGSVVGNQLFTDLSVINHHGVVTGRNNPILDGA